VPPTSTLIVPDLSPEVLAFAAEKGVTEYLPALIQLAQRIYPDRPLKIVIEDDPELSYNRTIVFQVDVGNMDSDSWFETTRKWYDGLFECCPATHVHTFGLDPVFTS
jgi:hypothetical protein